MKSKRVISVITVLCIFLSCNRFAIGDEVQYAFYWNNKISWTSTPEEVKQANDQLNLELDDPSCLLYKETETVQNEEIPLYCAYLFDSYGHLAMIGRLYEKEDYDSVIALFDKQYKILGDEYDKYENATVDAKSMVPHKDEVLAWRLPDQTIILLCLSNSLTDISTEIFCVNPHYTDEFYERCGIQIDFGSNNDPSNCDDASQKTSSPVAGKATVSITYDNDSENSGN